MKGSLIYLAVLGFVVDGSFFERHFTSGDEIPVNTQSVSPFNNPSEKYAYHQLPWPCNTQLIAGIGTHHIGSLYRLKFRESTAKRSLCGVKELSEQQINAFIRAIDQSYQYEMLVDDLPLYGAVGFKHSMNGNNKNKLYFLITHRHFYIKYNNDQIITVNVSTRLQPDHYVEIKKNTKLDSIQMTYSVEFSSTKIPYQKRYAAQMVIEPPTRYQLEAHWLWILNSSLLVILLTGLLSMILLRTLKNDVARYLINESDDYRQMNDMDEYGWKRLKFDVFRPPTYPYLFSAIIGIGSQILMITCFLLILAVIGYFYPQNHPSIYLPSFFLYVFTSYISGYVSSSKLKELLTAKYGDDVDEKHDWMVNWCLVSGIFAVPVFIVFIIIDCIAANYKSEIALPLSSIVAIALLWAFVTLPLTAFGSFRGGKAQIDSYPCSIKKIKRHLPEKYPWYFNQVLLFFISGFLPFLSIYVELHTIFMSAFGHQYYTLFGILLVSFIILLIITSFITILITYFQLNAENYKWYWSSLIRSGSCGVFIMFYSVYYWYYITKMNGVLQDFMYFGSTFVISYSCSLMLSLVGHVSTRWFIIKIYTAIKPE